MLSVNPFHSLRTCLFVIPFSVIVSRIAATPLEIMKDCRSTSDNGVAFNELQTVLLVCVVPSYSSSDAVIGDEKIKELNDANYFISCREA